jgi:hypothetical protein
MTPETEVIDSVEELYDRGLILDALHQARIRCCSWRLDGIEPCILAARIAANAGAPLLSTRLVFGAWRADRKHPATLTDYGYGPLAVWKLLRNWDEEPPAVTHNNRRTRWH